MRHAAWLTSRLA